MKTILEIGDFACLPTASPPADDGGFGLSQSAVSERSVERSARALEGFETRSLEDLDPVALIIDAKHVAGKQMMGALGPAAGGKNIPLSFAEASAEHHEPVKSLLRELVDRGLSYDQRLLVVTDGARGPHKAIRAIFSGYALIQRRQWSRAGEHRRLPTEK